MTGGSSKGGGALGRGRHGGSAIVAGPSAGSEATRKRARERPRTRLDTWLAILRSLGEGQLRPARCDLPSFGAIRTGATAFPERSWSQPRSHGCANRRMESHGCAVAPSAAASASVRPCPSPGGGAAVGGPTTHMEITGRHVLHKACWSTEQYLWKRHVQ